jgi:bifunctional oligoribonuclease and PAP phosphatase NrnA
VAEPVGGRPPLRVPARPRPLHPPEEFPTDPEVLVTFDLGNVGRLGDLAPSVDGCRRRSSCSTTTPTTSASAPTTSSTSTPPPPPCSCASSPPSSAGPLTRDVALCLYVGLVTDTGRFRYPNTTPDVFHLAEELAEYDLPIARITRELFEKHRFQYVQLLSMALARAELDADRHFVVAWLTAADLARYDVTFDETEGFIDHVRACQEAEVACVLREAPGEGLRVSLRSTGSIDVGEMAARFGGGGHAFMAGFATDRPIPEVIEAIRSLLPERTVPREPPPRSRAPGTAWCSSTRRSAGPATTWWPSPGASCRPARSATPARSTRRPPACCSSASAP